MASHAQDPGEQGRGISRSTALKVGGAGLAAAAAASLGGASEAKAADGDPLVLGHANNLASSSTQTAGKGSPAAFLFGSEGSGSTDVCIWAVGQGAGVRGCGADGILTSLTLVHDVGVHGITDDTTGNGAGVFGENQSAGIGVWGASGGGTAVKGVDTSSGTATANGVWGSSPAGTGVLGSTDTGVGVVAKGPRGTALSVEGVAAFSNCGVQAIHGTVATPKASAVVTGVQLTTNSLILATLQTAVPGVFVSSAVPAVKAGKVTIMLSQAVTQTVKVAWFVVDSSPVVIV